MKFNVQESKIITPQKIDLDKLLSDDTVSGTNLSDTNQNEDYGFSGTKISDTKIDKPISSTKVSGTNLMNAYKRQKYDTLRIDFPKGTKERFRAEAAKRGISVTKMIQAAMELYLTEVGE